MSASLLARFTLARPDFALAVDLRLPGQGVSALFGPSGSGKTTCLRCIAGLERPCDAYLEVAGQCWIDSARGVFVPAHKRAVGYVFQDANLFSHLSVRGNLDYGLQRVPKRLRRVGMEQVLELLGIGHLLSRWPAQLSGGERQRVGIARALLTSPELLLMDEPLASLDAARKREILPYLQRLQAELTLPVIYVSHSADEVARLAQHVVLLEGGKVTASGPTTSLLLRPDLPFSADDDAMCVLEGTVSAYNAHYALLYLTLPGSPCELRLTHVPIPPGQPLRVQVRARDVSVSVQRPADSSLLNRLPVLLHSWQVVDAHVLLTLRLGGQGLLARITRYSFDQLQLTQGQALWAQVKSVSLLS